MWGLVQVAAAAGSVTLDETDEHKASDVEEEAEEVDAAKKGPGRYFAECLCKSVVQGSRVTVLQAIFFCV